MKILGLLLIASISNAHGTDQPGPHGGMIQMPGAYHVEAVRSANQIFKIYLLDGHFENPVTKDSSVKARILSGKNLNLECQVRDLYFECRTSSKLKKKETLIIESIRAGAKGNEAQFEFK